MKKRVAIALLATSFTAGAAGAADRPVLAPRPYYAGPLLPVDWTGFYFGVNGGYGWAQGTMDTYSFVGGRSELNGVILHSSGKPSGGVAGGQMGFNWQVGRFVFGAEIDGQWSGQQATFAVGCNIGCSAVQNVSIKTFATGRARFGLAYDWLMPYVTAGAAMVNVSDDLLVTAGGITGKFQSLSGTTLGWTAGAGVDVALTSNLSARLEYLYVRAEDHSTSAQIPSQFFTPTTNSPFVNESGAFQNSIVRVGLNYRFGPRGGPGIVERPLAAPATYASAYDFLPSMPIFADRSRSEKRAPAAPMIAETPAHAPVGAPASTPTAPVAVASANGGDFKLPPSAPVASESKPTMPAVAAEPRMAKSPYKNFDEIEDADLTGGAPVEGKAITLPTVKRQRAEDDSPRLKRLMSICSGC
jgi:outer membrane immunogenic protein